MDSSEPVPAGTAADGRAGREVRIVRRIAATPETVWAALTEPDRLDLWIGRWEGDPRTGRVTFFMTSEGDDVPAEEYTIVECDPPRLLAVEADAGDQRWHLRVGLERTTVGTTLTFAQPLDDGDMSSIGPGWEYYLDRLVAVVDGRDPQGVGWDDYYPSMSEHYGALA